MLWMMMVLVLFGGVVIGLDTNFVGGLHEKKPFLKEFVSIYIHSI